MATTAKTKGNSKKKTTTPKTAVKTQLAKEAVGQTKTPVQTVVKENQKRLKW